MKHLQRNSALAPRIGWLLTGDYTLASSRLQGYRVHEYLTKRGLDSRIVADNFGMHEKGYSPIFFSVTRQILRAKLDIVLFQKPGWMMFKMSELLRLRDIRTISIQCDPFPGDYERYFDNTIVTSEELKRQLNLKNAQVIDDMIEVPAHIFKRSYAKQSERLRVVWVGQGMGPAGRKYIEPFLAELTRNPRLSEGVEFVTISRGDWTTHEWSLDTVYEIICGCDVAIIPLPEDTWVNAKSTNRLTMLLALGMPTVASPIPSYKRIIRPGETGLLARNAEEFAQAIEACQDESVRKRIGTAGRSLALEYYSPQVLGPEWIRLIEATCNAPYSEPSSGILTRTLSRIVQFSSLM